MSGPSAKTNSLSSGAWIKCFWSQPRKSNDALKDTRGHVAAENDGARRTKDEGSPNAQMTKEQSASSFVIRPSSLDIRRSSFRLKVPLRNSSRMEPDKRQISVRS